MNAPIDLSTVPAHYHSCASCAYRPTFPLMATCTCTREQLAYQRWATLKFYADAGWPRPTWLD